MPSRPCKWEDGRPRLALAPIMHVRGISLPHFTPNKRTAYAPCPSCTTCNPTLLPLASPTPLTSLLCPLSVITTRLGRGQQSVPAHETAPEARPVHLLCIALAPEAAPLARPVPRLCTPQTPARRPGLQTPFGQRARRAGHVQAGNLTALPGDQKHHAVTEDRATQ
jgi:hypothetical protein